MSHASPSTVQEFSPLDRISNAYSDPGWWYNLRGLGILTFAYQTTLWSQMAFLEKNIGEKHLEVPVGTGTLLSLILRWRRLRRRAIGRITAVDYSETMVRSAKRALARWDQVTVERGDVAALPYPDHSFDTVNIANGFHCFPDPDGALMEIRRVLRRGGTVATNVLLFPRGRGPRRWVAQRIDDWGQRKGLLVSPFELDDILNRFQSFGFELLDSRLHGNTVNILARSPQRPT